MRFLDYIEYSVSPAVKIGVCILLLAAIIVVYCWEPLLRRKPKKSEKGLMQQMDVDPVEYSEQKHGWYAKKSARSVSQENQTLMQLQQYVEALKQQKIHSIDDV